jgi:hypothetical protein
MLMVMVMPLYPSILRNQERSKWPTRLVRLFCQGVLLVLIVKNNWVSLFCQGVSDLIGYFSATERERSADSFERLVCPRMRKRTLYVMKNIGREWWVWGRTYTSSKEMNFLTIFYQNPGLLQVCDIWLLFLFYLMPKLIRTKWILT